MLARGWSELDPELSDLKLEKGEQRDFDRNLVLYHDFDSLRKLFSEQDGVLQDELEAIGIDYKKNTWQLQRGV